MVGTAQAADFAIFMRKIGYSVGLEHLIARVADFGRVYGSIDSFRYTDWVQLVEKKWNLKSANIADVFGALRVVRIFNGDPIPGPIGEALGILSQRITQDEYERAVRFLTLLSILNQDGDIFLNALAASFERDKLLNLLLQLIRSKREILYDVFHSYQEQEAVYHAVAIDRQRNNRGSSAGGASLGSLEKGRPLTVRSLGLGLPRKIDLARIEEPSDDYLAKVLVTRRGWAESLGLFSAGGLTSDGTRLLSVLRANNFGSGAGSFLVWPTTFEVSKARFELRTFGALHLKSTLETMHILLEALQGPIGSANAISKTSGDLARYIADVYAGYRTLSQNRSMIRNELPLEVLGATLYAEAFAKGLGVEVSPDSLRDEDLNKHGIVARSSQSIELAISVKRQ